MITYKIINSGSDGNAVIINDIILIDCGVPYNKLHSYINKLSIVLLTHIHSDHFKVSTIKKLAIERPALRFACCSYLAAPLIAAGVPSRNIDVLETGITADYGLFKVKPIHLTHNVPNCGYKLYFGSEKMMYATDTATLDGITAKGYDLYMIEGNYDENSILQTAADKVSNGEYSYEKDVPLRHLSIQQCEKFIADNADFQKSVYLVMHRHKNKD